MENGFEIRGIKSCIVARPDAFGRVERWNRELRNVDTMEPIGGYRGIIVLRDPINREVAYLVDKGEYASAITDNRELGDRAYLSRN